MPRSTRTVARPTARLSVILAQLLLAAAVLVGITAAPTVNASAADARTWVIDAVDDAQGNRWESADDPASPDVTINVGDTVQWEFDRATMGHDVTSQDYATPWSPPLNEYRDVNGAPVTRTFTAAGTYYYYCSIHGTAMSGKIVVLDPGTNQDPTATPVVTPTSGQAPLRVDVTANAGEPDGDPVAVMWDFGTGAQAATATTDHASFVYDVPGQYVLSLRITDGRGGLFEQSFPISVSAGALPSIDALAAAGQAAGQVEFSTRVTTGGAMSAFSSGLTSYPGLAGTATMVRQRGQTYTSLRVDGVKPSTMHMSHVHEQSCTNGNAGAHFRFDDSKPFAEANEIWPGFTSDASGSSGLVEVVSPQRAGSKAVSVVIHDPDNPSLRIGCADLAPATAGLVYSWNFGDGTTGTGADPAHTYAQAGAYTATVTVSRGAGPVVQDTVRVVASGSTPPVIVVPPTPPTPPVVTPVDTTGPRISRTSPKGKVRDRTPTIRATVRDRDSQVVKKSIRLKVDGKRIKNKVRFSSNRGLLRWTPKKNLSLGKHVVKLKVKDSEGNRSTKTWRFKVRR